MDTILNLSKEMSPCEFTGSLFGLIGAFLVATHGLYADFGFIAFLISNVFFIRFALMNGYFAFLLMQAGFTITSLIGVYQGFLT